MSARECTSRGSASQSRFIIIICTLLLAGSQQILAILMATVEVSHKAASVHSLSKITDSYVASLPGLPHIITFSIHSQHFQDNQRLFRTSIKVWQKVFPEFIDCQLWRHIKFNCISKLWQTYIYIYIYIYTYDTCCYLWPLSAIQCLTLRRLAITMQTAMHMTVIRMWLSREQPHTT